MVIRLLAAEVSMNVMSSNVTYFDRRRECVTGAILAFPLWEGAGVSEGHGKNFVGHMYKYAVFDIKSTYNH